MLMPYNSDLLLQGETSLYVCYLSDICFIQETILANFRGCLCVKYQWRNFKSAPPCRNHHMGPRPTFVKLFLLLSCCVLSFVYFRCHFFY